MAEEKNIMTGGGELDANCDRFKNLKHSTVCPFAFTEQGVAMLASVLRSELPFVSASILWMLLCPCAISL